MANRYPWLVMHSVMLPHLMTLLSVIPDGLLCTQPLKCMCQQQESSWAPTGLPTTTSRKLFYRLQNNSGDCSCTLSVLPQMCHLLGLSSEHLMQLDESQPNLPASYQEDKVFLFSLIPSPGNTWRILQEPLKHKITQAPQSSNSLSHGMSQSQTAAPSSQVVLLVWTDGGKVSPGHFCTVKGQVCPSRAFSKDAQTNQKPS